MCRLASWRAIEPQLAVVKRRRPDVVFQLKANSRGGRVAAVDCVLRATDSLLQACGMRTRLAAVLYNRFFFNLYHYHTFQENCGLVPSKKSHVGGFLD